MSANQTIIPRSTSRTPQSSASSCLVGFGDSQAVLLFGFLQAEADDVVTGVSGIVCLASAATLVAVTVALVAALIRFSGARSGPAPTGR